MKKLISVILAVIIAFSCCSLMVFAAEGANFTNSYFVNVAPACAEKLAITSVSGTNYVVEGGTFQFTAEAVNALPSVSSSALDLNVNTGRSETIQSAKQRARARNLFCFFILSPPRSMCKLLL